MISLWSAECAEFASIVIELEIGLYYPLQTITCLLFSITKYISRCEVNKLLCLKTCNHYVLVITFVLSITATLVYTSLVSDLVLTKFIAVA